MGESRRESDSVAWSSMWQQPIVTSFIDLFPDNYDGPIRSFWEDQLSGRFNHVVDLGCGNGALTWICNEILNRSDGKTPITGIDSAAINPFKSLNRKESDYPAVRFIGNTYADDLPFEDKSVDLVVSQFGFEYSNRPKTIVELNRIVSATGKISFIMHDQDSTTLKESRRYRDDYQELIETIQLDELVLSMIELYRKFGTHDRLRSSTEYRELVGRLAPIVQRIEKMAQQQKGSTLFQYLGAMREAQAIDDSHSKSIEDRERIVTEARDALLMVMKRLDELVNVALSPADRDELSSLLADQGFVIETLETIDYMPNANFGTKLVAGRSA